MEVNPRINDLISRKLTNTIDEEEEKEFEKWIHSSKDHFDEFEQLKKIWNERLPAPLFINLQRLKEKIWKNGVGEEFSTNNPRKQKNINIYFLKAAAVITILVSIAALFYYSGFLDIDTTDTITSLQTTMVKKVTSSGRKSKIILPDGTIVWLNSESEIQYPEYFNQETRKVKLVGEAYFIVSKDTIRPFQVAVRDLVVTAVGTQFNISSFATDSDISIALLEGRIEVLGQSKDFGDSSILLNPGDGIFYKKSDETVELYHFELTDFDGIIGWKDGKLVMEGSSFEEFVTKIERWYGVEVQVTGYPNEEWDIHATFENEYLSNVLQSIKYKKDFTYTLDDKNVKINFNAYGEN